MQLQVSTVYCQVSHFPWLVIQLLSYVNKGANQSCKGWYFWENGLWTPIYLTWKDLTHVDQTQLCTRLFRGRGFHLEKVKNSF